MGNSKDKVQAIMGEMAKHYQRRDHFPSLLTPFRLSSLGGICFTSSASPFRCFAAGTLLYYLRLR